MEGGGGVTEAIAFLNLSAPNIIVLIFLGFMGGVLSGFLGSGGAFILTPGMMALGMPGITAVGSNLAHKFGKAVVGSRKHAEGGNVDVRLGLAMFAGLIGGLQTAIQLSKYTYEVLGKSGSDLYVSSFFIITLSIISVFMVRDARRSRGSSEISKAGRKIDLDAIEEDAPEKSALVARVQSLRIPPMITLKKVNVRVSLWFILLIGFATGFMAGTIGVGGFIGVPAMIYLLGVPTLTAAGTELFIAIFSGAFGAFSYAVSGYVDIKVVLLLYLGSILGVHVGATATKMVDAAKVRMVMALVIILAVVARIFMVPSYLQGLDYINGEANLTVFTVISDVFLFGGGIVGTTMIIISMKKFRKKMAERRRAAVNQMVPHPSKQ